ncbi:ubiquitin-conjugating enzyme E2 G1 isoform X2 [Alligator mississippiensis]|uniref:ubiquitin-conjugating enzyme E2 G1 isoform X2 n=1 Tax=Alligator mississippiensis TaxID=8496 RepID=UPI002877D7B7|nr:ubiquitin-conjugating enzyme E2 G1 isoform X2 [Alligator mississippiensis]
MAARPGRELVVRVRAGARSAVKFRAGGGRRRRRGGDSARRAGARQAPAGCGGRTGGVGTEPGGGARAGLAAAASLGRSSRRRPDSAPGARGRMTELQSALLLRRQLAGGVFKAHLTFPKDYPLRPPKMKFITEIWHPNVDKNGDVCISILHEPGEDKYGYEKPEERWLPIHTVETIMISVISMLADPNGDSPANVDAAKEWREDRNGEFKRKVARCVRKSQETAFE